MSVRAVLDDPRVAAVVRELDVEALVLSVLRVEGEPEQALLAAVEHLVGDVEERRGAAAAPVDDDDPTGLLDDVQPAALVRRGADEHRIARAR